ncbi:hypothetical protein BDF20DRAFT_917616 [Mycotypha africana]|uniref:uncharacterized protein n=1 Tax=Mycotypha africana TaxID=64632 RepID=UPI002300325B|nr:uncharacterized protein BDF20DRAFT_917616 [Mycotypha africana]KAI8967376.1 hypothetical protein BDF20DRAFT_917616 [Mycotypha africana]
MLLQAPFEIIEIVNSYLTIQDRTELVRVSKDFQSIFTQLLYRFITITTYKQLQQLLYLFQQSEEYHYNNSRNHQHRPLGHCVYQLSILLDALTEHELNQVKHFCPCLQTIHIDWRIWNYLAYRIEEPNSTVRNYFPRREWPSTVVDFISYYGSCRLSSLTLDIHRMHGKSRLSMSKEEIIRTTGGRNILCNTPYLRHLTLMGLNQYVNVSFEFIESIHRLCPLLETLAIDAYQAEALSDYSTTTDNTVNGEEDNFNDFNNLPRLFNLMTTCTTPSPHMRSFHLKSQYGADRYYEWLPFLALKYPNLQSLDFHHAGTSKDMIAPFCPISIYQHFLSSCPHIRSMKWNNAAPDFRFFHELNKLKYSGLSQLEIYDQVALPDLFYRALFDCQYINILEHITELTLGPLPTKNVNHQQHEADNNSERAIRSSSKVWSSPDDLIKAIGEACPKLLHLELREPHCNISMPFKIDTILNHCPRLKSLSLNRIALRLSTPPPSMSAEASGSVLLHPSLPFAMPVLNDHPLRKLVMHHCSSFDGVFTHISYRCRDLKELELFAFTQRDRRYKVQIHMPYQSFTNVQLHGLRTETFDLERRIRFFSISDATQQQQQTANWYYMKEFHLCDQQTTCGRNTYHYRCCLETANQFNALTGSEVCFLRQLLARPMAWEEVELMKREFLERQCSNSTIAYWQPKDIYDAGYVDFVCSKVDRLVINKKRILNDE